MTVDKHRSRCFLDVDIEGENIGRIIVELFSDACPKTSENFRALCTGEMGKCKSGNPLHYKGVPFHRIVKGFMVQGGDFIAGNGTGGESIYGGQFKDENFDFTHEDPFMLSMANKGKDSNGSQFFITTRPAPHLDGKNTVFGQVISGHDIVLQIENIPTDPSCRPLKSVNISNCGELLRKKRKKSVSVSGSEDGETKSKKKKKKHSKHSKKHKREKEKREIEGVEEPPHRKMEDFGVVIDPDEIPVVPVNNFLLRRASPIRDNRRIPERDMFSRYRPSKSKSGRNLKGRGLMRYRTPSRSRSRSGSNTPPHWREAQSKIKKISEIDLRREATPSDHSPVKEDDEDEEEESLEIIPRVNLQARYNRDSSPARDRKENAGRGGLRSMVTVTSNFAQESNDRNQDRVAQRRNFRRAKQSPSPEHRYPDRKQRNRPWRERSRENRRRNVEEDDKKSAPQKKPSDKSLKDNEADLLRSHKNVDQPSNSNKRKHEDTKSHSKRDKENVTKKTPIKIKKEDFKSSTLKSLSQQLFIYQRKSDVSEDDAEVPKSKSDAKPKGFEKEPETLKESDTSSLPDVTDVASIELDSIQNGDNTNEPLSSIAMNSYNESKTGTHNVKVKEKRRWDVKESTLKENAECDIPACEIPIPDMIPLPEETSRDTSGGEASSNVPGFAKSERHDMKNFQEPEENKHEATEENLKNKEIFPPGTNDYIGKTRSLSKSRSQSPTPLVQVSSNFPAKRTLSHSKSPSPRKSLQSPHRNSCKSRMQSESPVKRSQHSAHSGSKSPVKPSQHSAHSRSKSPVKRLQQSARSRSKSPVKRLQHSSHSRSKSPVKRLQHSSHSRSKSPVKRSQHSAHSRSKSPVKRSQHSAHSRSKSPIKRSQHSAHSRSKSPIKRSQHSAHSRSKSPIKRSQHSAHSRSKSPIKRRSSRTPEKKSRRSRSKTPRSKSGRQNRSRSNRRSTSRKRYDRSRRSPSPRFGGRRGLTDRRGGYQRRAPVFRGRGRYSRSPVRRSRSPVRRRRRSSSSSSRSSSSNSSSSSGKRVTKKTDKSRHRKQSSSSSSSGSTST